MRHGDVRFQLIEELAAHIAPFGRVSAIDTVARFRHRYRTDDDRNVSGGLTDSDCFRSGEFLPLGRDQDARIEY
jgi:hypothetical protein